ncbi:MAG: NifB/NifX family molybdenum-iron cluster-binding protein [Spirochaetaceae bacterium]
MNICIPTAGPSGLNDSVYGHFGSAPYFTIVDTDTHAVSVIDNSRKEHGHGNCAPSGELIERGVDAVVCGGMGRRALARFNEAGIRVFLSGAATPADAVQEVVAGIARECTTEEACAGHHGSDGHDHDHGRHRR